MKLRVFALVAVCTLAPATLVADDASDRLDAIEKRQDALAAELEKLRQPEQAPPADSGLAEVERRQGILTNELRRLREALVLPETQDLKSAYGLGPAASKVYGIQRGLSIGGYGESNFKNIVSDRNGASDEFDFLRLILYVGYKYNDWIVFNSETEFEHATTSTTTSSGGGSVSVEFATLDFLLHPLANVRAGLLLVPVGILNELHESPFFHGNVRPEVESRIIPSTWRAGGFGLHGELLPGLEYRTYGLTSMNAEGFNSGGIRDGRQSGNREKAEDWSWVGRVDYDVLRGVTLGASAYVGDQGQDEDYAGEKVDAFMQLYELHVMSQWRGLECRALAAVSDLDDAAQLSAAKEETVGSTQWGWYAELAYDVLPLVLPETTQYVAPWFRYTRLDTQESVPDGYARDDSRDRELFEIGVSYKPIPQVVVKLDYRNLDNRGGNEPDEIRIGAGFVF